MAVIPFPNLQPQGPDPRMVWGQRTLTKRQGSPLNGVATTLERPGSVWTASLPYANLLAERRAQLQTFAVSCRGYASRFYMPLYGWTRRGSFSAPELFTNNTFASGTTGWTANSTTHTVADGISRLTVPAVGQQSISQSVTLVQYAPYALRSLLMEGRGSAGLSIGRYLDAATAVNSDYGTSRGLGTIVRVNSTSGAGSSYSCVISSTSGYRAGDYVEVGHSSLARCALVDNGANFTQRSDELDNAYWTKSQVTISANAGTAVDRTATADTIVENGAAAAHFVSRTDTRTATAADWCIFGTFRRASGTRNIRLVVGRDASNYVHAIFDLSGGTIAQAAAAAGDATNARAFIVAMGGGNYYCALVGRLTATTGLQLYFELANGTTLGYTGDSASGVYCWRCGAAASGVPTRGMQTTSAGDSDGTLQTGSALYLKGLPASTTGLLLQGDPVEIITNTSSQLVRTRAPLNSDAAGLGYLQFEAPLRISPLDNAGVIVCNPLCRMMLDSPDVSWSEHQQAMSDFEFAAIEDTYP